MTSIELGKRARACKHFRWMPGMRATEEAGGCDPHLCEADFGFRCPDDRSNLPYAGDPEAVPDVSDPATVGCLLALAREAYGDPSLYARMSDTTRASDGIRAWEVLGWLDASRSPDGRAGAWRGWGYASEAEALVAALEAAP